MKKLHLHKNLQSDNTSLSNVFIDEYMPEANGEYVKVYIYLLRCLSSGCQDLSLSAIADKFDYTEKDVKRALKYWSKRKLIQVELGDEKEVTDIHFLEAPAQKVKVSAQVSEPEKQPEEPAARKREPEQPESHSISANRRKKLREKQEIKQLLFIAEQYIGKTLSATDVNTILYFYDELHFSVDLIEYLIEYSVCKGVKSMHYMKTVALAWAESSITTVADAKESTNLYHRNSFKILKAFGISGRNPVESEVAYIDKWLKEYDFTLDILLKACDRTMKMIHQPSFEYADSILTAWKEKGVKHLPDIDALDRLHEEKKASKPNRQPAEQKPAAKNKFNNFESRKYNLKELEKELLNTK